MMKKELDRITAFAPATVANLGVGFDILGLATSEPGDHVQASLSSVPGVHVLEIHGDEGKLPHNHENTAVIAATGVLKKCEANTGIELVIHKGLPLASGLGSSAASAVAAAVATDALLGRQLNRLELLAICLEAESAVSGRHADNIAPALYGGIVLLGENSIKSLPVPTDIKLCLITPKLTIATAKARAVLPESVPLSQLVQQTAAVALLIDAFHRNDMRAASLAMENDRIIEPARANLLPVLPKARHVAKAAGAYGLIISGAGPTLCAFCDDDRVAANCAESVAAIFQQENIQCKTFITRISERGAYLIDTF